MTAAAASPGGPILAERVAGTDDAVAELLARLRAALMDHPAGRAKCDEMMMVLGEVCNNAVEHALADRSDGWVELDVSAEGERIDVVARDDGRPMPPFLMAGRELPDMGDTVDDLPEGGFGWFIIHSLAQDMTYEREESANRLTFSL